MAHETRINFRSLPNLDAVLEWCRKNQHELHNDQYFPAIEEA
jgi:hypothetical protein